MPSASDGGRLADTADRLGAMTDYQLLDPDPQNYACCGGSWDSGG